MVGIMGEKLLAFGKLVGINGMFYDPLEDKIHDFIGGKKDLEDKLLRFIGDPEKRIKEDHLRILRAIRFKNEYNLQYHPNTYQAIKKLIDNTKHRKDIQKLSIKNFFHICP